MGRRHLKSAPSLRFRPDSKRKTPFFVMLFTLAQFELGVRVSPLLPGAKLGIDPRSDPGLVSNTAAPSTPTLIGDPSWDPWDHFEKPIAEVRATLGIKPRGREPEYLQYDDEGNIVVSM